MKLLEYPFMADQNVTRSFLDALRASSVDVVTAEEWGLATAPDTDVLARAMAADRVVLTHDRDFGGLAVASADDRLGLVLVRPGHAAMMRPGAILSALRDVRIERPFVVVAQLRLDKVRVRVRKLGTTGPI